MSPPPPRVRDHLQLFNPSHKNDLTTLFVGVKPFQLWDNNEDEEDTSKTLDEEFVSDDDCVQDLPEDFVKDGVLFCTTCEISLANVVEQRFHYRLDWHRYNLKRKVCGNLPVTEALFGEMIDDLSSIEGSDCEDGESPDLPIARLMEKVAVINDDEAEKRTQSKSQLKLQNSPKLFFENSNGKVFSMFKSIVNKGTVNDTITENGGQHQQYDLFSNFSNNPPSWALIMVSGGHFAAAVFEGGSIILHKTYHSYTVRAKQGGSQGAQDGKSGTSHPKSAGASLRRYNEASFAQHVEELLNSWRDKLKECLLIFYRAEGSSGKVLFGGKNPVIQRSDTRVRKIPIPSKRPTLKEVKRVHSALSGVHVYGIRENFIATHLTPKDKIDEPSKSKKSKKKNTKMDRAKSRSPVKRDEPERPLSSPELDSEVTYTLEETFEECDLTQLKEYDCSVDDENHRPSRLHRNKKPRPPKPEIFPIPNGIVGELVESISVKDVLKLEEQLSELKTQSENRASENSFLQELNQPINIQSSTILHLAACNDQHDAIWRLLECGCDPSIKDKNGKYAYNCAESKESRMVFRKFRGQYPEKYDYDKAQIPPPLSEEKEQEKLEKKRAANKLKREKEKQKKQEKKEKEKETEEQDRFMNLSDREKRALAAERRLVGQCKRNGEKKPILVRCFECATDITGKVPFEYNQNLFCSSKCLVVHRKKFPTDLTA